jgi:superfamily II DNA helicase RecQ
MQETFGLDPHPWQADILSTLFLKNHGEPYLLVRPTGGGKSMIRDVFASTKPGTVILSIAPLLSLSKDQTTKLQAKTRTHKLAFIHLDEYRSTEQVAVIIDHVCLIPKSNASLLLFASPQILGTKYLGLLKILLEKKMLSMVCVDEAHLFVQFGLHFRSEFLHLKGLLFSPLIVPPPASNTTTPLNNNPKQVPTTFTAAPVLFMTATADKIMLDQLEQITGYCFSQSNLFWPNALDMQQRRQQIRFMPTTMVSHILRSMTKKCFTEGSSAKKFIVYSNSRRQVEQCHSSYRKWMDSQSIDDDVILIVGTQSREQKFHRTTLFLNPSACHQSAVLDFNAKGCFTTRAMGSAGWDDPTIHYVCSIDFPVDMLSIAQEKGRAGRRFTTIGNDDTYYCVASLESYLYLLRRIEFDIDDSTSSHAATVDPEDARVFDRFISKGDYKTYQLARLSKVVRLFVLPTECQQCTLEKALANPFSDPDNAILTPCGDMCQFCLDGGIHPKFPRINVDGVRAALVDLFLGVNQLDDASFEKGGLIDALRTYPNASMLFFGVTNSKTKPTPIDIKNLLLMLLTADIITHKVVKREIPNSNGSVTQLLIARLQVKSNGTLALHDDTRWNCIPTI